MSNWSRQQLNFEKGDSHPSNVTLENLSGFFQSTAKDVESHECVIRIDVYISSCSASIMKCHKQNRMFVENQHDVRFDNPSLYHLVTNIRTETILLNRNYRLVMFDGSLQRDFSLRFSTD